MNLLWNRGPLYVKEMIELFPEPKPHFNTISTVVRNLEEKGYVNHTANSRSYRYHAAVEPNAFSSRSLFKVISNFFSGSYIGAVSTLVKEEKISVDELKELIAEIEKEKK